MKYGKRWMDKFGLSAAVWVGFNLYFFFFIQDGKVFHELRRQFPQESRQGFYGRILQVMAQLGGGSANVL